MILAGIHIKNRLAYTNMTLALIRCYLLQHRSSSKQSPQLWKSERKLRWPTTKTNQTLTVLNLLDLLFWKLFTVSSELGLKWSKNSPLNTTLFKISAHNSVKSQHRAHSWKVRLMITSEKMLFQFWGFQGAQ